MTLLRKDLKNSTQKRDKFVLKELNNLPWDFYVELYAGYSAEDVIWDIKELLHVENVRLLFCYSKPLKDSFGFEGRCLYLEWIEDKNRKRCRFLPEHSIYQVLSLSNCQQNDWLLVQLS